MLSREIHRFLFRFNSRSRLFENILTSVLAAVAKSLRVIGEHAVKQVQEETGDLTRHGKLRGCCVNSYRLAQTFAQVLSTCQVQ